MSDFIENVIEKIRKCVVYGSRKPNETESPQNWEEVSSAIYLFDSLGENARRLLEVGRIQDFLMDNDFEMNYLSHWLNNHFDNGAVHVYFSFKSVEVITTDGETFEFDTESKKLYEDVTAKVEELIK